MYVTDNSGAAPRQGRGPRLGGRLGWQRPQGWHRPQGWQSVLAAGLVVFLAASVALVTHTGDPASADTYVTSVRNAVIRLADGSESTAQVGARLPKGAQLRTGQEGGAELTTAGRVVYVGALSTVDVLDGVHQSLTRGQVMVDSRNGPRLQLTTRAGIVAAKAGALSRIETATYLRLAVFEGSAAITATGRRATTPVGALHQVQVPYGYVAGGVTPLALKDDRWETRLASHLVEADQDLTRLADSLGGSDGAAVLTAAPAALRAPVVAAGPVRGELALTVALAQAATSAGSVTDRLATVRSDRTAGGSWGVVAALVGARVTAVSALLDGVLTLGGAPPATVAGQQPNVPGLFGPSSPTGSVTSTGRPTATPTVTPSRPRATATPTPTAATDSVVTTVLGLIPTPSPAPITLISPTPSPSPLLVINLNLG